MIETYKILSGKYDIVAVPNLTTSTILTTRGNNVRLQKNRTRFAVSLKRGVEFLQ